MSEHDMNFSSNAAASGASNADAVNTAPKAIAQKLGAQTRKVVADVQQNATQQVQTGIDGGMQRAAGALKGVADSLTNGSAIDDVGAGRYVRQAGEQVRRAAEYLEKSDVKQLARDTESFARRQPAAFLGGAFVLGVVAARLFKSSQRADGQSDEGFSASRTPEPFPIVAGDAEFTSDRGPERGGWYAAETPMDSYREPLPPSRGEQP